MAAKQHSWGAKAPPPGDREGQRGRSPSSQLRSVRCRTNRDIARNSSLRVLFGLGDSISPSPLPSLGRWPALLSHEQGLLPSRRNGGGNDPAVLPGLPPLRAVQAATLLKQFGADKPMPTMLRDLKPCNVGNSLSGPQCQLRYWDSITSEVRAEAGARGGLPTSWNGS